MTTITYVCPRCGEKTQRQVENFDEEEVVQQQIAINKHFRIDWVKILGSPLMCIASHLEEKIPCDEAYAYLKAKVEHENQDHPHLNKMLINLKKSLSAAYSTIRKLDEYKVKIPAI
jgi:hypothetical protein